jgi:phenylacetaldehyde dehydrogenase
VESFLQRRHGSFVDGKSHSQRNAQSMPLFDPASAEPLIQVELGDLKVVDAIVKSAHRAFSSGTWSTLAPCERERLLLRFADTVEAHGEVLTQLETLNQGKPCWFGAVQRSARRWFPTRW